MDPRRLLAPLLFASASAVVTLAELQTAAARGGYRLEPTGAGPFYRINLHDAAAAPHKPKTLELPSVRAAGSASQRAQRADDLNTIESLSPRGEYPEPSLPTTE